MMEFDIIVSSENSPYLIWQTQLFCFSAISRLGKAPIVIVHRQVDESLDPAFNKLSRMGCHVLESPSFRKHPLRDYPCRNEAGSLFAFSRAESIRNRPILFCESDMLFVRPLHYTGCLAGEYYSYLDYSKSYIASAAVGHGISYSSAHLNSTYSIGVPYFIPSNLISPVAQKWLDILDSFEQLEWIDLMYAFGLATASLAIRPITTHMMDTNQNNLAQQAGNVIHYCYGDIRWDKRQFTSFSGVLDSLDGIADAPPTSILGEIRRQALEAAPYFKNGRIP